MIRFTCAGCAKPLQVPANVASRLINCPRCRHVNRVPEAVASPDIAGETQEQATLPPAPAAAETATLPPTAPSDAAATLPPLAAFTNAPPATLPLDAGPASTTTACVTGYEILSELGRGGMGVVYQARQTKLRRIVALKMILSGGHASSADLERFKTEAEAIARLQHSHIVQIYEVGEHNGLPYFSLEFCGGGSLEKQLAGTPLPPREAAALVEKLAGAMQAAHDQHVIHRDLKPANVLLTEDGTPKITDFGLAKKLDEQGKTQTGSILGTPSYMAPEQAGGRSKELGPACDIYALGAILYECLTGRPPFRAATPLDTVLQVVSDEPVPPTQLNAKVPRDLETICLKCLCKDPARRYRTAQDLAEDLRRYQVGEPIVARPASVLEKAVKWARRKPSQAIAVAVSLLAAVTLLVGGLAFTLELQKARDNAEEQAEIAHHEGQAAKQARDAEKQRAGELALALQKTAAAENAERQRGKELQGALTESQRNLANSVILLAQSAWNGKDGAVLANHYLDSVPPAFRNWEWGYLKRQYEGSLLTLHGHARAVANVVWSKDGYRIASGSVDQTVRVWDARTGQILHQLKNTWPVMSVWWSVDGSRILSRDVWGQSSVWDATQGDRLEGAPLPPIMEPRQTSLDGKLVCLAVGNHVLVVSTQIEEEERLRRLWLTRADPAWHVLKRQEFLKEKNGYAAALHHAWEEHAHGVIAFDHGDFDQAFAHFIAAAALNPVRPSLADTKPAPAK
jgi:tRNA A-37 threonylcarbamoyl transferase component Bud32